MPRRIIRIPRRALGGIGRLPMGLANRFRMLTHRLTQRRSRLRREPPALQIKGKNKGFTVTPSAERHTGRVRIGTDKRGNPIYVGSQHPQTAYTQLNGPPLVDTIKELENITPEGTNYSVKDVLDLLGSHENLRFYVQAVRDGIPQKHLPEKLNTLHLETLIKAFQSAIIIINPNLPSAHPDKKQARNTALRLYGRFGPGGADSPIKSFLSDSTYNKHLFGFGRHAVAQDMGNVVTTLRKWQKLKAE
jgi:hypothetical protein